MILSKKNIKELSPSEVVNKPAEKLFDLPEKVLQFGTGVLLRGLPDYFIDKANKLGIFNGRIVVVKSTSTGGVDAFAEQDGMYTLCIRGVEGNSVIEENIISTSISRVLSAKTEWEEILHCAANPEMEIVISNTTEAGIALTNDNIHSSPPESFPGKLLAFLYRRYEYFGGDKEKGMIIIPTELLTDNGTILKNILIELSKQNGLDNDFITWMTRNNEFCNSLVDRIVPGKMAEEKHKKMETELGYKDDLMIMSELYRLWAIESNEPAVSEKLSFSSSDEGVIITNDIGVFRELKLRLLNGSHTFSCALAYLCGFTTVKEAMDNKTFLRFISELMLDEIVPAILNDHISKDMATEFAHKVIDRYRNPNIEHQWLSIAVQYSLKMKSRNIPVIEKYYKKFGSVPECMAMGFAAFLLFMKSEKAADGKFSGFANNKSYPITDEKVSVFSTNSHRLSTEEYVSEMMGDESLWDYDLSKIPGFVKSVTEISHSFESNGVLNTLENSLATKSVG